MQFSVSLALALTLAVGISTAQQVTVSKTDIGSILKSMDQSKLKIPANARAVMKKMPEEPKSVTTADRGAVRDCMANANLDAFSKIACAAQDDQCTLLLDRQAVSVKNMQEFVKQAVARGGKIPAAE